MTQYFGDYLEDETVYIPFNTFDSNDPSASVTITNLADADIMVHKDGSVTQIATDGATVAIDFDSITGNHLITIDTSASADYSTGSDYLVRIEGTTVDAATINAWVGSFSIENRAGARALRATTAGRTLDVTATGAAGIDWGNIENASTAVDLSATDIQLCDTITTYTGNTVQTGDSFARLGAPAGASVSADVADIPTVAEFNARTLASADYFDPTTDAVATVTTLTNLPSIPANWLTAAGIAASALNGKGDWNTTTPPTAVAIADQVWDEDLTGHQTSLSAGRAATLGGVPIAETTATGTPTTSSIQLTAGSTTDGFYEDQTLKIVGGAGLGQARIISSYTGATRTCTFDEVFVTAPISGDAVCISLDHIHPVSEITADMDANSTQLAAIVADTNELQGDWVNGGRLDLILDATSTQASVDTVDSNVDAILVDTNTTIPGLIAALNNISEAQVNAQCDTAISDAALATAASLATVDSVADAIKVVTDQFVFTIANQVDSNVQSINDVTITGDGSATPFDV